MISQNNEKLQRAKLSCHQPDPVRGVASPFLWGGGGLFFYNNFHENTFSGVMGGGICPPLATPFLKQMVLDYRVPVASQFLGLT